MQNASALHTNAWVEKTKSEAEKEFKKWKSAQQKKWQQDYMQHCSQTAAMILANAQETLSSINALKTSMKTGLDGVEKIVTDHRASGTPLSDGELDWVEKTKGVIDGSAEKFAGYTKAYSDNSPFAYRDGFMDKPLEFKALTADMVAKIKAERKAGIDVGNEFGKQSPVVARMAEYRERWKVLSSELEKMKNMQTGKVHLATAELTKQINELEAGNKKWEFDFANDIGKLITNIEMMFGGNAKVEKGKGFGSSLLKNAKLLVDSKAKAKNKEEIIKKQTTIKMKLDKWATDVKGIKGALKTRVMTHDSLAASLKEAGPGADPFRAKLAEIDKSLKLREQEVDDVIVKVNEAIAELKK